MPLDPDRPVVALLTDFGLADPYAGQMRAVLAARLPTARILDLSHGVPAHDILAGAFFLAASLPWLPRGSVTAAVVDPGVGSSRRIVGISLDGRLALAPDNGLLTLLLTPAAPDAAWAFPVPADVCATFHGRDVFAPLAASLAAGVPPATLGQAIAPDSLHILPGLDPRLDENLLHCRVLHADRFGNLILNLEITRWQGRLAGRLSLAPPLSRPVRRVRTYADIPSGALGLVAGSQGYFELAGNRASAAAETGLGPGHAVVLSLEEPPPTGSETP
jgi:S-adenosylmethionine hydrolase